MAEQVEDPQGERRPPVGLVAVDDHRVVAVDALGPHEGGEGLPVDDVAGDGVVEVLLPVDAHRAGEVADVVEEGVLVGLDDAQARRAQACGQPGGGDESLRVGVLLELGVRIEGSGHVVPPFWATVRRSDTGV